MAHWDLLPRRFYKHFIFLAIGSFLLVSFLHDEAFSVFAQTTSPSFSPTWKPSRKPTKKPTKRKSIYFDYAKDDVLDLDIQQGIVGALIIGLFICMAFEIAAPEVLFLIALMVVVFCEILTLSEGLAGFSNTAMITIGALYLVVGAVEKSHVIDWAAKSAFGTTGASWVGKARLYVASFFLSCFLNNTPIVAILMPVVKDWSRMRGIAASQLLMPFEFAVIAGSFGSMIGTSTNLTLQGLMSVDRNFSFSFFAPAPFGIPCFVALFVYMMIAGDYLLPKSKSGLLREARDKAKSMIAEIYVSPNSPSVGKSVAEMMGSLGMSASAVIKIRRRNDSRLDTEMPQAERNRRSLRQVFDTKYWKDSGMFWSKNKQSGEEVEYTAAKTDEVEAEAAETTSSVNRSEEREAEFIDIVVPGPHELISENDVVFVSSAQTLVSKMMKSIMGESKGLSILNSDVRDLPGFGSELLECVISDSCEFIGKKVSELAPLLAEKHGLGLITVRGKRWAEEEDVASEKLSSVESGNTGRNVSNQEESGVVSSGDIEMAEIHDALDQNHLITEAPASTLESKENEIVQEEGETRPNTMDGDKEDADKKFKFSISDHILAYGDILLCVAGTKEVSKVQQSTDFFVVSAVGALPKPLTAYGLVPLLVFLVLLILAALEMIDICAGSMICAAFFFIGGWITAKDIPKMVDVRLLLLLGASISFASSMTKSGLAATIAKEITDSNPTAFEALVMVYAITLAITSLVSNNAAAALMYPISVKIADELGVSFKPFAMCVLLSASATFMVPVGYQTHIMVWAPGGYRFRDFLIFGALPNAIYLLICCYMIPALYPFN